MINVFAAMRGSTQYFRVLRSSGQHKRVMPSGTIAGGER